MGVNLGLRVLILGLLECIMGLWETIFGICTYIIGLWKAILGLLESILYPRIHLGPRGVDFFCLWGGVILALRESVLGPLWVDFGPQGLDLVFSENILSLWESILGINELISAGYESIFGLSESTLSIWDIF